MRVPSILLNTLLLASCGAAVQFRVAYLKKDGENIVTRNIPVPHRHVSGSYFIKNLQLPVELDLINGVQFQAVNTDVRWGFNLIGRYQLRSKTSEELKEEGWYQIKGSTKHPQIGNIDESVEENFGDGRGETKIATGRKLNWEAMNERSDRLRPSNFKPNEEGKDRGPIVPHSLEVYPLKE